MTDEEIAIQIVRAAKLSTQRFMAACAKGEDPRMASLAEFMSGGSQVANFLVRTDGDTTAQQIERALKIAGENIGMYLGPAN